METGIYTLTRAEYDAVDAVNASTLKACDRSMLHGKAYRDGIRKETAAMSFGSAYHKFVLERDDFERAYVVIPKMRRAGKAWEEAVASAGDEARILFAEDLAEMEAMRAALLAESRRRTLTTTRGLYEASMIWIDAGTGLLCKGRLDKLIDTLSVAVDLKTTTDARPRAFQADAARYGYDLQSAFYMDGLHAITGREHDFAFLAQESDAPYASMMYTSTWGGDCHSIGRAKYRALLNQYAACVKAGQWPGYGDKPVEIVLPAWSVPDSMKEQFA